MLNSSTSPEVLAAWDRWCRALVEHYRDRVAEWEVWNETDLNKTGAAAADTYVDLYIRTDRIVREVQPADRLRAIVAKHGRLIELRQGETGAPSKYQANLALSKIAWPETMQAKWDLRRRHDLPQFAGLRFAVPARGAGRAYPEEVAGAGGPAMGPIGPLRPIGPISPIRPIRPIRPTRPAYPNTASTGTPLPSLVT